MASVDGIRLDTFARGQCVAAVAIRLRDAARESEVLEVSQHWEAELKAGSKFVVVRTDSAPAQLLDTAINAAQAALDLVAVGNLDPLATDRPGDQFLILQRDVRLRLTIQQIVDFRVRVGTPTLLVTRADGTVEEGTYQYPQWTPAFRFYRLSQVATDVFEAYRNLFLSLEALLDQVFAKRSREGEREWLYRATTAATHGRKLNDIDPTGGRQSARDLIDWFYDVRINLFHAKQGRTYVPDFTIAYSAVASAYGPLLNLWRLIAEANLGARGRSGALTYVAFRMGMESGFADARMAMSPDTSPVTSSETLFSPSGDEVTVFPQSVTIAVDRPGRVLLSGELDMSTTGVTHIGRVGVVSSQEEPMVVSDDCGTIATDGLDAVEVRFVMRLLNTKLPRTEF